MGIWRINRYLAACGLGSRRSVEKLVRDGRVKINGETVTSFASVVGEGDMVTLNGRVVSPEKKIYLAFNKPSGSIVSWKDPAGRETIYKYIHIPERVFYVGRLDYNTSGLLLLTNDGELAFRLTPPSYQVEREYLATVCSPLSREQINGLRLGRFSLDGKPLSKIKVDFLGRKDKGFLYRMVLTEGRYREIRRIFEKLGTRLLSLHRTGYGVVRLGRLPVGRWRHLSKREVAELRRSVGIA